ncbi:MAG: hypothetical protein ACOVMH_01785 [Flavobacterium sp.]
MEKTKKQTRVLVSEDKGLFNQIIKDFKQFLPILTELKKDYENLEIGEFNEEAFKILKEKGTSFFEDKFILKLNKELDKMGAESAFLRNNISSNSNVLIEKFKDSYKNAKKFIPETYTGEKRPTLKLEQISYKYTFFIDESDEELILENYCRLYLETETELNVLAIVENLKNAANKLLNDVIEPSKMTYVNKIMCFIDVLKLDEQNKFTVNYSNIKGISRRIETIKNE